jgi:uracil-DNA glycosylase family 4
MTRTDYGSDAGSAEVHPARAERDRRLARLAAEISRCRRCPRLVEWREQAARERRAAFRDQRYWGRPVPGFGDPRARVLFFGLAPAAHGANRTGRMFTGDRSGDFLFAALWRTGFANQPTSVAGDDGLRLRDAFIVAAVRCAPPGNRPTPEERENCLPWSLRELALLSEVRVVVCLGAFAWDVALRLPGSPASGTRVAAKPRFAHGAELAPAAGERQRPPSSTARGDRELTLLGCFHPSQQNTFTGRLSEPMIDEVLVRARALAGLGKPAGGDRAKR